MRTREHQIERLGNLIAGIEQVMFTTINPDGIVNSRPMLVQDAVFDGTLWFFTKKSSCKVESIGEDSRINLAFMDPSSNRFISMSGYAEIMEDDLMMKKMGPHVSKDGFTKEFQIPILLSSESISLTPSTGIPPTRRWWKLFAWMYSHGSEPSSGARSPAPVGFFTQSD